MSKIEDLDAALVEEADRAGYLESHREDFEKTLSFPDYWARLVLMYLIAGCDSKAKAELEAQSPHIAQSSPKHVELLEAVYLAYKHSDLLGMRSAVERFSQRDDSYVKSILPVLLNELDRILVDRETRVDAEAYDYSVTSYSQWIRGLALVANGKFEDGRTCLLDSLRRYEIGNMVGDVLWSWFDSIIASLLLDDIVRARCLHDTYLQLAESTVFGELSSACLQAYEKRDPSLVDRARLVFVRMNSDFANTSYPRIFEHLASHVAARLKTAAVVSHSSAQTETKKPRQRKYMILKCEPARVEDADMLAHIAAVVNLGNTRPSHVVDHIQMSDDTLTGALTWQQGLVFLATHAHLNDSSGKLVGSCKLQFLVDGCWRKQPRKRLAHRGKQRAEFDVLRFDNTDSKGIELAGNVVDPDYRRQGIGTFHTHARLLFVQIHEVRGIETLFADLLTKAIDGSYPFYEQIVKPMLGGISYDDADDLRYSDQEALGALLGSVDGGGAAVEIPLHALPKSIVEGFGEVRKETHGAQKILKRYGFHRSRKFDLLDGGQYYSMKVEDLGRMPIFRKLTLEEGRKTNAEQTLFSFAPTGRPMTDFRCIRAPGHIDDLNLIVPQDVLNQIGLPAGGEVLIVVDLHPSRVAK